MQYGKNFDIIFLDFGSFGRDLIMRLSFKYIVNNAKDNQVKIVDDEIVACM